MRKICTLLALLLTFNAGAFALLPPAWQDVAELKSILSDTNLKDYLNSGDVILQISKDDHGWLFITNHTKFYAEVVPKALTQPGPERFDIHFKKITE